jgi:DNA-binding NarL/FixJ family response regulator
MADLEFLSQLKDSRFFVFSDLPDDNEAYTLLRMGAVGYANTYISPVRLAEAVRAALGGRVWIGQKLMQKIIQGTTRSLVTGSLESPPGQNLSDREWQVALGVSKGRSNLEIAAELDITERTVKAHIGSIFKKTTTASRLQLALHVKNLIADK